MDVRPTAYSAIDALYERLCAFERHIPFAIRCRTALLALPSVYADAESAIRDSPAVSGQLALTFQQFTLALNVSEAILFLQRPYFVRALQESPQDPTRSTYAKSYLAVVERCNVLIEVVGGLYELYPTVTARHWFFWYHLFTAAVCLGTMIILNPTNPLAGLVLGQIDHSIKLYSSVLRDHATPSLVQNHQWLLRLRARALSKVEHAPPPPGDEADVDVELLGWRTRLVERAREGKRATTIRREDDSPMSHGPSPASIQPQPLVPLAPTIDQVLQQHFVDSTPQRTQDPATDFLLHQFWDPTTLLESREGAGGASNWWNTWDLGLPDLQNPM
ncbi:hypothetical protein CcaverHIS002_0404450 [Cutaneotrichosporon cavernicola]|nr:hypothetical protein CcaverHIS002_0404450 [Cutaneotrichosporon cavernicola]